MATLTIESFTEEPIRPPTLYRAKASVSQLEKVNRFWKRRMGRLSLQKPIYTHDRTIVTGIVLVCGTFLLWHYGDSSPIVALVSSAWTLALTFWFRFTPDPEGKQ